MDKGMYAFTAGQGIYLRSLVSPIRNPRIIHYICSNLALLFSLPRNLFHILTIGSTKQEHKLYGFHRGYLVSPHHVSETIRNVVAYFLSCDVCRDHFLSMYDGCGYDHCKRLISEIDILCAAADGTTSPAASIELALWLWEVHNSVNERLMRANS